MPIEHIVGPADYPTNSSRCCFRTTTAKNLRIGSSHIAEQQPASHGHLLVKELASATLTEVIDHLEGVAHVVGDEPLGRVDDLQGGQVGEHPLDLVRVGGGLERPGQPPPAVDEPHGFTFRDGFADLDFTPNPAMPVSTCVYTFTAHDGGTRATYVSTFGSAEALQQVLDMGVVEGASSAINQIDAFLA